MPIRLIRANALKASAFVVRSPASCLGAGFQFQLRNRFPIARRAQLVSLREKPAERSGLELSSCAPIALVGPQQVAAVAGAAGNNKASSGHCECFVLRGHETRSHQQVATNKSNTCDVWRQNEMKLDEKSRFHLSPKLEFKSDFDHLIATIQMSRLKFEKVAPHKRDNHSTLRPQVWPQILANRLLACNLVEQPRSAVELRYATQTGGWQQAAVAN